jgi:hypothetical protein
MAPAPGLAAQQQMGDARMRRQFGHGLTVGGQRFAFQCAQALQQVLRLGIRGCRRHIEPDQLPGVTPQRAELQARPARSADRISALP